MAKNNRHHHLHNIPPICFWVMALNIEKIMSKHYDVAVQLTFDLMHKMYFIFI